MSGPVAIALIAALGTVMVALTNSLVTRGQSKDARARLQRDIEAIGKLEKGSLEFSVMEEHILRSVLLLTYTEQRTKRGSWRGYWALSLLTMLSWLWFGYNVHQNRRAHFYKYEQRNWISEYFRYAFEQNRTLQALLLTFTFIFYFAALSLARVYQHQRRRAKVVDEVEEKLLEIRQQSINQEDISTRSTDQEDISTRRAIWTRLVSVLSFLAGVLLAAIMHRVKKPQPDLN